MKSSFWAYVPRKPRYTVREGARFDLEVVLAGDVIQAQLVDISRNGFCVDLACRVERGAVAQLHLKLPKIHLDARLPATVRWARPLSADEPDRFRVGFTVEEETPLEVIGELMLEGIISEGE